MFQKFRSSRAARLSALGFIVAVTTIGWVTERALDPANPRARSPLPPNLSLDELAGRPLFTHLEERERRLLRERRHRLERPDAPQTEPPGEIRFEASMEDAIERATREDKPIVVFSFVRENADPLCDV